MGFFKKTTDDQDDDVVDVDAWLESAKEPSALSADTNSAKMVDVGEMLSSFTADPPPPPPLPNGPFAFDPSTANDEQRHARLEAEAATDGAGIWHFPDFDEAAEDAPASPQSEAPSLEAPSLEAPSLEAPSLEALSPEVTATEPLGFGFELEAEAEAEAAADFHIDEIVHEAALELAEESLPTAAEPAPATPATSAVIAPSVHIDDDGVLRVSDSDQATVLLSILGIDGNAAWTEVTAARNELLASHDPEVELDPERAALAVAIRREMNTAYVALRLLAVP